MKPAAFRFLTILSTFALLGASTSLARELTFEERVQAQEAIERVYYSHQIGATRPFEEAVPRELLQRKVLTYLRQSAALESQWNVHITAALLHSELQRIAKSTRLPERLTEIYQALNMDPLLIEECLVRPELLDRLARQALSSDPIVQAASRNDAETLRSRLQAGTVSPFTADPHRSVAVASESKSVSESPSRTPIANGLDREARNELELQLNSGEFAKWRSLAPRRIGEIGSVLEDRESFNFRVVLGEARGETKMATYTFPKIPWDEWWGSHQFEFDESSVRTIAAESLVLPSPSPLSATGTTGCLPADTWDRGALDAMPDARSMHTAVWTGSLMIVWGGGGPYELNSGGRYDPAIDSWSPTSTVNAPAARVRHSAIWTGREMIVWGGRVSETRFGSSYQTGGRYDPIQDMWTPTSTVGAPTARISHTAVWTGREMLIWGGAEEGITIYTVQGTGGKYDPATDTWHPISMNNAPRWRSRHTGVWTGSEMIIWGGVSRMLDWPYGSIELSSGSRYDPLSDTWHSISVDVNTPVARKDHSTVWTGRYMIIWGGQHDYSLVSSGGRYDPVTDAWFPVSATGTPTPRRLSTAIWTGTEMIIWGGTLKISVEWDPDDMLLAPNLGTGGRYDPESDRWTPMTNVGAPVKRSRHTAVWTGSLMVVWGGLGGEDGYPLGPSLLDTGGRYDPSTDTWTPTSPTIVPEARSYHTSVWTGNIMIVWGGEAYYGYPLLTGGRYDPLLDNWSYTSTENAPARRSYHTAVWTGNRMIVWGGIGESFALRNTGGLYDPVEDSWASMTTIGAPQGRMQHSAVWTGSKMIVWGGDVVYYYGQTNTGGVYDPLTNTWSATSVSSAPTPRSIHTAIWTGSQMVVWGGSANGNANRDPGGRYDPGTDQWLPVAVANAPLPRYWHTAVWTGTRMIVWGGGDSNTGGRYDPETDTWTSTSTVGAPSGRQGHTVVWTGSQMIIWGGISYFVQSSGPGGRYDPVTDSWSSISANDAPLRKTGHTALWTGEVMLIWGGYASNSNKLGKGGRYAPSPTGQVVSANAGADQILECANYSGATINLSGGGDACDPQAALYYTWHGPFPEGGGVVEGTSPTVTLPLGSHNLTLRVEDSQGHSSEDEIVVTVSDTTPPDFACPIVEATECSSAAGAPVVVPPAVVTDSCDASPIVSSSHGPGGADASGIFPLGSTEVTMTARDASGNQTSCAFPIIVQDTTPPQLAVTLSSSVLWPPNHRMVDVTAPVAVTDACSSPSVVLDSITSSELDDAPGSSDGNTSGDIQGATPGTADFAFQLRAERDGGGGGRLYRVTYSAIDSTGNRSTSSALILVPHDQGGVTEPLILTAREEPKNTTFSWNAVPNADAYGMIRGEVGGVREAGGFIDLGSVSCIYPSGNLLAAERTDSQVPPPGRAYFYLVSYNDGMDSGYGTDTVSKPRISTSGGCGATGIHSDPNSIAGGAVAPTTGDRLKTTDSP